MTFDLRSCSSMGEGSSLEGSASLRGERSNIVALISLTPPIAPPIRLADLHRTMNVHAKPPSVTAEDEGAWQGVWPTGRMVGKKGDILKLVIMTI